MELPLCLVCEEQGVSGNQSLLLTSNGDNVHLKERLEYALGVPLTLVTPNHSALCVVCGRKLDIVGGLLTDLRLSYNRTLEKYGQVFYVL